MTNVREQQVRGNEAPPQSSSQANTGTTLRVTGDRFKHLCLKKKNLISGNLEKKSNFLLTSLNSCKEKFICRIPWVFGLAFKEPGSNTS